MKYVKIVLTTSNNQKQMNAFQLETSPIKEIEMNKSTASDA